MALRRQLALLRYFRFFSALRFAAPLLVIYFAHVSGSYALGMSVFSIASVSQLLFDIPAGVLSDRVGRKPVMVAGAAVSLLFTVSYAVGRNYWFLALGGALEGLARALFSGNDTALLYETLADERCEGRYAEQLGKIGAGTQIAFAIAALAGGLIATRSFQLAFWLTLLPQAAALGICTRLREPRRRARTGHTAFGHLGHSLRQFARNRRLRLLVTAAAWQDAFGESAFQFRLIFFQLFWPIWALGAAQTLTYVVSTVSFYVSGRVIGRLSALKVLVGNVLVGRLLNGVALLFPSVLSPALMSLTSVTYGMGEVAMDTLQQQEFSDEQRATMGSVSSQALNLGFAVAAVALGALADRIGAIHALIVVQVLLLVPLALYRLLFSHDRRLLPPAV